MCVPEHRTLVMSAQARLFLATGKPVQPHDTSNLDGLGVSLRWCRLPPRMLDHVGLEKARTLCEFCKFFHVQLENEDDECQDCLPEFVPSEDGVQHELPDGVITLVRLRMFEGRYVHDWVLPNRRISIVFIMQLPMRDGCVEFMTDRWFGSINTTDKVRSIALTYCRRMEFEVGACPCWAINNARSIPLTV